MTTELQMVVYSALILIGLIAVQGSAGLMKNGIAWGLGNREDQGDVTPLRGRVKRAIANQIEAMLMFVPLALAVHLVGGSTKTTAMAATIFVLARLAYAITYVLGIKILRTLVWAVGLFATFALIPGLI